MEKYVYKGDKKLRCGYTTGSCAAAAAKAAAIMLLKREQIKNISLMTPKGIKLQLNVEDIEIQEDIVRCAVKKDAGDDADCTDGIFVYAAVSFIGEGIEIDGGEGVGRVTKPGLEQPEGAAAINRVPRRMIREAVMDVIEMCSYTGGMRVVIYVPNGAEISKKTFNPQLGIEGGISILGTSGIVEPMSERALIDTIHTEMKMKTYSGSKKILITPGNYGRDFAREKFDIDIDTGVKCSNFIGETIDMAYEFQLEKMLIIGHVGKLIKVAAGIMNTHSRYADGRMEIFCAAAVMAGADNQICRQLLNCITTDEALNILSENNLTKQCMDYIMQKIEKNLNRRAYDGLRVEAIVFSNEYGVLGMTDKAMELLEEIRQEREICR